MLKGKKFYCQVRLMCSRSASLTNWLRKAFIVLALLTVALGNFQVYQQSRDDYDKTQTELAIFDLYLGLKKRPEEYDYFEQVIKDFKFRDNLWT